MNQVRELQSISHELLYLGIDGTPSIQIVFANLTQKFFACPNLFLTEKERRTRKRLRFALRC